MRTINLYDVVCFSYHEYYQSTGTSPLVTQIKLMPATIVDRGAKIFERNWKRTDWQQNNNGQAHSPQSETAPTEETESETDGELLEMYFCDSNGNRIEELEEGDFTLVLESRDCEGQTIDIELDNPLFEFYYQGSLLEDDILRGYTINSARDEISISIVDGE